MAEITNWPVAAGTKTFRAGIIPIWFMIICSMQEHESAMKFTKGSRRWQEQTSVIGTCASVSIVVITFSEKVTQVA
jgi:uncharacterized ion transporter superfamily protein YfcC